MKTLICLALLLFASAANCQQYEFEPSNEHPFGRINPEAPAELADFDPLIGRCDCKSVARIDINNWADTLNMSWTFKYIMNGTAVQDETLKPDGVHSGSIRQYNADSSRWYVHYYSSGSPVANLPSWEGGKAEDGNIVLYREQNAPNGMEGFFKIIFSDITQKGFNWSGAWVNAEETIVYPTWLIFCKRSDQRSNY